MPKINNFTGKRFGRLVAIKKSSQALDKSGHLKWLCRCDCGKNSTVNSSNLKSGNTKSCGCWQKEHCRKIRKDPHTHGLSESKEYRAWRGMKERCTNPKTQGYKHYGGRGITVCEKWKNSFSSFYEDVGPCPSLEHSIDRTNNEGNYEPGNVKWVTRQEQGNNTRANVKVTVKGKTDTLANWCRVLNLNYGRARARLIRGWSPERAFDL